MGAYAALGRWLGARAWFRPVAQTVIPAVDRALLRRFGWRSTPWPTLLLATTGRTSGAEWQNPLYFVEHGEDLAVLATNYGRHEPAWSLNLRADPNCRIKMGRRWHDRRARPAGDDEWQAIFDRFADFYPQYRSYLDAADREVPIWVLEARG